MGLARDETGAAGLFVFGCGFSAGHFARTLGKETLGKETLGKNWRIAGVTTRSTRKAGSLAAEGLNPFLFDGTALSPEIETALMSATHLLVSIAPGEAGDPVLPLCREAILSHMPGLEWIGYLSTVGVYGDHGGAWVDETTPTRPVSQRSTERVEAEAGWTALAEERRVPLAILRLSGIYGPGRNAFVNLREGKARRLVKPGQVFNRIHVADIAGALTLLAGQRIAGVFNVTDDEPAPPQDVVEHAARLVGLPVPPAVDFDTAALSPMARSFYGENKRVSNALLKRTGYTFVYPTYRAAFPDLVGDFCGAPSLK